jgi:hypothetical protein
VDKVAARGPHCAWLCCPCLETWETTAGWPGWGHGGSAQGQPERGPGGVGWKAKMIAHPYKMC